jgi:hypothetical protein
MIMSLVVQATLVLGKYVAWSAVHFTSHQQKQKKGSSG